MVSGTYCVGSNGQTGPNIDINLTQERGYQFMSLLLLLGMPVINGISADKGTHLCGVNHELNRFLLSLSKTEIHRTSV
jgi:hypothetical protein